MKGVEGKIKEKKGMKENGTILKGKRSMAVKFYEGDDEMTLNGTEIHFND